MKSLLCPICKCEQKANGQDYRSYSTTHPLFASCKIISCQTCQSSWVPNAPDVETLTEFYQNAVFGDGRVIRYLNPTWIALARCQSLARWRFILKGVQKARDSFSKKKISVCDIGAGFGSTLEAGRYLGLNIDYFGVESSFEMRKRIQAMGGQVLDDFFKYEFPQGFDLVWAAHILEHYPQPGLLLKRMQAMMQSESIGFIEVPCLDFEFKQDLTQHLLFFSKEGLQKAIERNGFQVMHIEEVGKLRQEAKREYQKGSKPSLKSKIKSGIPKFFLKGMRHLYRLSQNSRRDIQRADEDFSNQELFAKWDLESYGTGRCWLRAVFTKNL